MIDDLHYTLGGLLGIRPGFKRFDLLIHGKLRLCIQGKSATAIIPKATSSKTDDVKQLSATRARDLILYTNDRHTRSAYSAIYLQDANER